MSTRSLCHALLLCGGLVAGLAHATEVKIYGKVHVSGDFFDAGAGMRGAMNSNSTTLGFSGSEMLSDWLLGIWRIESNVDVTGERGWLLARNRYLGLASPAGTLTAGYQDTPMRIAGAKFDIYGDTVADYRNLLGTDGAHTLDIHAKNSLLYQSPKWGPVQLRVLQSTGEDTTVEGGDTHPVSSASLTMQTEQLGLAVAYEEQSKYSSSATRVTGTARIASMRLNGLYESLRSDATLGKQRQAFGGNMVITLPANFSLHGEGMGVIDGTGSKLTAALAVAGVSYAPAKSTQIYLIVAQIFNNSVSKYIFNSPGREDRYTLTADKTGFDPYVISLGVIQRF